MTERQRKHFGEFYTPRQVVNYILDTVGFIAEGEIETKTLIDPACGDGVFLVEAVKRLLERFSIKKTDLKNPDKARIVLETISNNIYGIDISLASCQKTKENLLTCIKELSDTVSIKYKEFSPKFRIFCFNALLPNKLEKMKFDFVVGNPPYMRIHRIKPNSLKEKYRSIYDSAVGRFDTSVLFTEKGIQWLKPAGVLGFIVSNKFLVTRYGKGIRGYITKFSSIVQIVNLTDIEPFQVAVLPCIIILKRKTGQMKQFRYCVAKKIRKEIETKKVDHLFEFIKHNIEKSDLCKFLTIDFNGHEEKILLQCFYSQIPSSDNIWFFIPPEELKIANKLTNVRTHYLEELAEKINVGVKTTANSVFANPVTKEFLKRNHIEPEVVHPCLRGTNLRRWKVRWNGEEEGRNTYLIYPHQIHGNSTIPVDLNDYPRLRKYLDSHRQELAGRTYIRESGRRWYEIWVHQDPRDFNQEFKIVTSDLSSHNTFAIDRDRFFCLDSCYYIILREKIKEYYKFILGLLNSKVLEFFHKRVASTHIYSNKYRYMTSYMRKYPIAFRPDGSNGKKITELVTKISEASDNNEPETAIKELEDYLDREIYELYELNEKEIAIIENVLQIW